MKGAPKYYRKSLHGIAADGMKTVKIKTANPALKPIYPSR